MDYWLAENDSKLSDISSDKQLLQTLRLKAEAAKKAMGQKSDFSGSAGKFQCQISRDKFNELILPLVEQTLQSCKNALKDAGLQPQQIDHIVMVGGSTRVSLVKEKVEAYFGKAVYDRINPDEVVALGAAVQADVLAGNQKDVLLLDVTPLSLGIETVGGLMDVIIPRNNKVPSKAGRQYTTSVDGQANLKIAVYQGERDLVENNRKLGEFVLRGIPPMPAGLPKIDIQFVLDADGILKVRAMELRSKVAQEVEMRSQYGISEEEMAKMLLESIQNAESDMKVRGLLEARNEANNILLSADKFLRQNESILSDEEKSKIGELVKILQKATQGEDKDLINKAMDDLNEYTAPLAHRAMDATIAKAIKGKKIG